VSGIGSITANKFVVKFPLSEFIQKFPRHLIDTFEFLYGYGTLLLIPIFIYVFISKYRKDMNNNKYYYLITLSVLPLFLLFFQKVIPFTRNWVYITSPIWLILVLFILQYLKEKTKIITMIFLFTYLALLSFSSYKVLVNFYSITNHKEIVCRELLNLENESNLIITDDLWYHYSLYYNKKYNYHKNLKPGLFIYTNENISNYNVVMFEDTKLDSKIKYKEFYKNSNFTLLKIIK
jgi:hypothetical protein